MLVCGLCKIPASNNVQFTYLRIRHLLSLLEAGPADAVWGFREPSRLADVYDGIWQVLVRFDFLSLPRRGRVYDALFSQPSTYIPRRIILSLQVISLKLLRLSHQLRKLLGSCFFDVSRNYKQRISYPLCFGLVLMLAC
jgi:hypothetical protein